MAIESTYLKPETFADKVLKDGLQIVEIGDFLYARGKTTKDVNVLYKSPKRTRNLWYYRAVYQQTNAAGGAVHLDIVVPEDCVLILYAWRFVNSGNNGIQVQFYDPDGNGDWFIQTIGAGAASSAAGPQAEENANTSGGQVNTVPREARTFPPGSQLRIYQSAAGVQNDTLTVSFVMELIGTTSAPDVGYSNSTNVADVTETVSRTEVLEVDMP